MKQLSWDSVSPRQVQSALNDVVIVSEQISASGDECSAQCASSTTGEVYHTSLSKCTCIGYQIRRLPCKHMIRLAIDAGCLDKKGAPILTVSPVEPAEPITRSSVEKQNPKSVPAAKQISSCISLVNLRNRKALIQELSKRNIRFVDCFDKNGAFWIEYTNEAALFVAKYTFKGSFAHRTAHSRHFKGNPGWFFTL